MHPNFWHWRNWTYCSLVIGIFAVMTLLSGASACLQAQHFQLDPFLPTGPDYALIGLTFIIEFIYNYRRRQLWLELTAQLLAEQPKKPH